MSSIDDEQILKLRELALQAVKDSKIALDRVLAAGRYTPHKFVPPFEVNLSGWPATVKNLSSSSPNDPVDYGRMLGTKKNMFVEVTTGDVPALQNLLDYLDTSSAVLDRMASIATNAEPDAKRKYAEFTIIDLVATTIERCVALGIADDDAASISAIYAELERGKFDPKLPIHILAPLLLTNFDMDGEIELAPNVFLTKISEPVQRARAPWTMSRGIPPYLQAAATHAVILKGRFLDNEIPNERLFDQGIARDDYELIESVCEVIHILTGRETGYGELELLCQGWADGWDGDLPASVSVDNSGRFPSRWQRGGWNQKLEQIEARIVAQLPQAVSRLQGASRNIRLAAHRAFQGSLRTDADDTIIDACIGIEALVGNARDEVTHRMAQRTATALRDRLSISPHETYWLVKQIYAQRSTIVHGGNLKKRTIAFKDTELPAYDVAEFLLRELLQDLLEREEPWTPDSLDQELLASLVASTQEELSEDAEERPQSN